MGNITISVGTEMEVIIGSIGKHDVRDKPTHYFYDPRQIM